MKAKKQPDRQWVVPMQLTHNTHIIVTAADADEAEDKAENMRDLVDDGMGTAELIDWERRGKAQANE